MENHALGGTSPRTFYNNFWAPVIEAVKEAGYKNVILRPLMVVAGDHANNDMAGKDSWKSMMEAAGLTVTAQIAGLGSIPAVQELYVAHTQAVIG